MSRDKETKTVTYEDDEGFEIELDLPYVYEVCPVCRGKGSHVNRAIDGNGITASEWAEWDQDDRESYFRGDYDVPCEECDGLRVIQVVDEEEAEKLYPDQWSAYQKYEEERWQAEAADRHTRRMERMWEGG